MKPKLDRFSQPGPNDSWYWEEGPEECILCGEPIEEESEVEQVCMDCLQRFDAMKELEFLDWLTEKLGCFCNYVGVSTIGQNKFLYFVFEVPPMYEDKINAALDANGRPESIKDGELGIRFRIKDLTK